MKTNIMSDHCWKSIKRANVICAAIMGLAFSEISVEQSFADQQNFVIHAEKPALGRSKSGNWDSAYLDPGTVIFHDETFHMFYVAIPKWPHPLAIGYAKSQNGIDWDRHSQGPVLTHKETGKIAASSIMSTSAVVTEDGTWVLYFTSVAKDENFYGNIVRATAPGPLGPWVVDPEPALTPGPKGAWDGLAVGDASVVRTEDGYAMYYAGFGDFDNGRWSGKRSNIGLATSKDGKIWNKVDDPTTQNPLYKDSDPILSVSTSETGWDTFRLVDPNVQKTPDGWLMTYRGATFDSSMAVGLAESHDGISWSRVSDEPIITEKHVGKTIFFTTFLSRPEQDYLYLELGSLDETDAFVATRQLPTQ